MFGEQVAGRLFAEDGSKSIEVQGVLSTTGKNVKSWNCIFVECQEAYAFDAGDTLSLILDDGRKGTVIVSRLTIPGGTIECQGSGELQSE